MKKIVILVCGLLLFGTAGAQQKTTFVSFSSNAYKTSGVSRMVIDEEGIENWKIPGTITLFFHISQQETIQLALRAKGHAQLKLQVEEQTFPVVLDSDEYTTVSIGSVKIAKAGYVRIDLHSTSKEISGSTFGEISDLIVTNRKGELTFVKSLPAKSGRMGPSLFLNYQLPERTEWFYSEITVPQEGERQACYYAANGFDCGYVGLYMSAPSRRVVMFNVWNPDQKPSERVRSSKGNLRLLRKDGEVIQEASLQQTEESCKLPYNWQAGETYRFLTRIYPDESGHAIYSAYFYHPEKEKWVLMGSYLRLQAYTGYTYGFSMLKNTSPELGYKPREMQVNRVWALAPEGEWEEVTQAVFATDIPYLSKNRLDYKGGVNEANNSLFLKGGGFFDDFTPEGTLLHRKPAEQPASLPDVEVIKQL
ncbi:MAG: DUF5077 domain-containing protein [Culturomica sp.]|jgi:hypothetical protein|nr:DUF5077 domain-containing protein [Culturomica sp.]